MEITQELINLVKKFEGLRLESYKDAKGVWTIGYGHTVGVKQGQFISLQEAENLLIEDLEIYADAVREYVTEAININMFSALTSFTFNVGINAFKSSTLLKELNKGNYTKAKSEFLRWNKSGG
ncbi:MAG: lysozyme, partial [Candidatus Kapabacteria bacterium]|nr:lysozyme [Candidatus Kapabacteria bacterium]